MVRGCIKGTDRAIYSILTSVVNILPCGFHIVFIITDNQQKREYNNSKYNTPESIYLVAILTAVLAGC